MHHEMTKTELFDFELTVELDRKIESLKSLSAQFSISDIISHLVVAYIECLNYIESASDINCGGKITLQTI